MVAFDTDVLSRLLHGDQSLLKRAAQLEPGEQSVPIVVLEEIMRGRLNSIRQAESRRRRTGTTLELAYELFERTFTRLRHVRVLPYGEAADEHVRAWRRQKLRVSTHDLRIAAFCIAETATLATGNRRDFERVPELNVEFWD